MFAQKWLAGFKWLNSGRQLDGIAHIEEMHAVKRQFGIKPRQQPRRQEQASGTEGPAVVDRLLQ